MLFPFLLLTMAIMHGHGTPCVQVHPKDDSMVQVQSGLEKISTEIREVSDINGLVIFCVVVSCITLVILIGLAIGWCIVR